MRDVTRLRLLLELQRRGSIAAVAEALHYSPSGVSQQLSQLETEAGVPLLERAGRRVRLTDAGRLLCDHAYEVVVRLERAQAELAAFGDEPSGKLRIACSHAAASTLIPSVLDRLSHHPSLRLEFAQVEPEEALSALLARDFDLIICEEYPGRPVVVSDAVDRKDLCSDELWLVAPQHSVTDDFSVTLSEVSDVPWVMEPQGTMSREWATNTCRAAGFEPDVRFESSDILVHRELVRRDQAAAFLPALLCRSFPFAAPTASVGQSRTLFTLVRKGHEHHPAVTSIRSALAEVAETILREDP